MRVTLYTSPGCGLCRRAEATLEALRQKIRFDLEVVNIDENEPAHRRFWNRIPVVQVNGTIIAEAPADESSLETALKRAARSL
jgi:glutaredoxin